MHRPAYCNAQHTQSQTLTLTHCVPENAQELGEPLLTLEAGIAAKSFFPDDSNAGSNGIMSAKREVGNAQGALAAAKNTIKGAR